MFRFGSDVQVYLHRNAVDFRLGINGDAGDGDHRQVR